MHVLICRCLLIGRPTGDVYFFFIFSYTSMYFAFSLNYACWLIDFAFFFALTVNYQPSCLENAAPSFLLVCKAEACRGMTPCMKTLIKMKADIKTQDKEGNTLLHYGAAMDSIDVCKLLIQEGIDQTVSNRNGQQAGDLITLSNRDLAQTMGLHECVYIFMIHRYIYDLIFVTILLFFYDIIFFNSLLFLLQQ